MALEDLLHDRKLTRSKSEHYAKHLFLRIVCHELIEDDDSTATTTTATTSTDPRILPELQRSMSPTRLSIDEKQKFPSNHITSSTNEKSFNSTLAFRRRSTRRRTALDRDIEASMQSRRNSEDSNATLNEVRFFFQQLHVFSWLSL